MNRVLYFIPVIVLLGIGLLFYRGLKDGSGSEIPSALIDQPMPALPSDALVGYEAGDLDAILAAHPVVLVNYFASWCAPCRAEHAQLIALQEAGIPVIGVNYKDDPDNAGAFIEEMGNPYEAIRADNTGRVALDWGVSGVPETFFLNSEGVILRRFTGPISAGALQDDVMPFIDEQS